jgi:hypothetical protein
MGKVHHITNSGWLLCSPEVRIEQVRDALAVPLCLAPADANCPHCLGVYRANPGMREERR